MQGLSYGSLYSVAQRNRPNGVPPCRCSVQDLKGGDAALNAQILRDVFGGQQGAVADALCLNAGVALAAAQVADSAQDGIRMAQVGFQQLQPYFGSSKPVKLIPLIALASCMYVCMTVTTKAHRKDQLFSTVVAHSLQQHHISKSSLFQPGQSVDI